MSQLLCDLKQIVENEIKALQEENIEEVQKHAKRRAEMIKSALKQNNLSLEVLLKLQEMNSQVLAIAKQLHKALGEQLKNTRRENQRFLGYKQAVMPVSSFSKYVNKRS